MADREDKGSRSAPLGARARSALRAMRRQGEASLRGVRQSAAEVADRLKHTQAAERLGAKVESRRIVKKATDAQGRGNHAMAYRLLEPEVRDNPDDPRVVAAFWSAALACDRAEDAVPAMVGVIRKLAGGDKSEHAAELWIELRRGSDTTLLDPTSLVRIAQALEAGRRSSQVVAALREAIDPRNASGLSPGLAVRIAEMSRDLDPSSALRAARSALASPDLHEAKRARLEDLVATLEQQHEKEQEEAKKRAARAKQDGTPSAESSTEDAPIRSGENASTRSAEDAAIRGGENPAVRGEKDGAHRDGDDAAIRRGEAAALRSGENPAVRSGKHEADHRGRDATDRSAEDAVIRSGKHAAIRGDEDAADRSVEDAAIRGAENATVRSDEDAADRSVDAALEALAPSARFSNVKITEAMPTRLLDEGIGLQVLGGRKVRVDYGKIDAVSVAEVRGLAPHPVIVIDLLLNWKDDSDPTLRVVRLRSDGFDPRMLGEAPPDRDEALRSFLSELLARSTALPLPDPDSALGVKLRGFDELERYQREVLQIGA